MPCLDEMPAGAKNDANENVLFLFYRGEFRGHETIGVGFSWLGKDPLRSHLLIKESVRGAKWEKGILLEVYHDWLVIRRELLVETPAEL